MKLRTSLIELFKRHIPLNTKEDVYYNGENNLYPNEIRAVISNSPTAKRAASMFAKYIAGKVNGENIVVNRKKRLRVSGLVKLISEDIAEQYGCFILVKYKISEGVIVPDELDVLDYTKCRIRKEDDNDNSGNIIYKNYEDKKDKKKKPEEFFPWTSDQKVLAGQIRTAGDTLEEAIKNFKGNVLFLNLSNYIYPLSPFDAVYNEMDSEYRITFQTNSMTRTGFLGKTAVIMNGLDEKERKAEEEKLTKWMGAENSAGLYFLDVDTTQDLDNVLKILVVKGQYDDKMFELTLKRIRENTMGAANNIPLPLVLSSEGAMFDSADKYASMKVFYSEQTEYERGMVQETLSLLGINVILEPL